MERGKPTVESLLPGDTLDFFVCRDTFSPNDGELRSMGNVDGFGSVPSARLEVTQLKVIPI